MSHYNAALAKHYPPMMRPIVRQLGEVEASGRDDENISDLIAQRTSSRLSWIGLLILAGGMFYLGRQSIGWKEKVVGGAKKRVHRAVREWAGE